MTLCPPWLSAPAPPADHSKAAALFCTQPDRIRAPRNDFAPSSPGACGVRKGERQLLSMPLNCAGAQQVAEPCSVLYTLPNLSL